MRSQVKIPDDLRIEQRHRVGGDRVSETRIKFFGHGCAASDVPAFKNDCFQSRAGKISSANQAIMAATDNCDIIHAAAFLMFKPNLI